jgi:hypothetical protein
MGVHIYNVCNFSTREPESGELQIQGQTGLQQSKPKRKEFRGWVPVAHTCNPRYREKDREERKRERTNKHRTLHMLASILPLNCIPSLQVTFVVGNYKNMKAGGQDF